MQEIKDMNTIGLQAYASAHDDVIVGRGNFNRDGLRNAIASAHLGGRYKEPECAAQPDFRAHRYFARQASRYTGLNEFDPAEVFSTITTDESGVTSMGGGNNLLGGSLRNAVLEMPSTAMTRRRGVDLPQAYTLFMGYFVAGGGTGKWRPVGNSGATDSDEPNRLCFELETSMKCSIFGTDLNMLTINAATPFTASINNVSKDDEHSEQEKHVWERSECINLYLNIPERSIWCLKQAWVMTLMGTLDSLRRKYTDRRAFDERVAQHTKTLLADKEWLARVMHSNGVAHQKDVREGFTSDAEKLKDRAVFIKWFKKNGAICENSEMLVNREKGPFHEHCDRCLDNIDHTTRNCRILCLIFSHRFNVSREQWLQQLLDQDLVYLTIDDRTRVHAELKRLAANEMMTRKHAARTGRIALAASADDSRFPHR
jgi:hypothetical protein